MIFLLMICFLFMSLKWSGRKLCALLVEWVSAVGKGQTVWSAPVPLCVSHWVGFLPHIRAFQGFSGGLLFGVFSSFYLFLADQNPDTALKGVPQPGVFFPQQLCVCLIPKPCKSVCASYPAAGPAFIFKEDRNTLQKETEINVFPLPSLK